MWGNRVSPRPRPGKVRAQPLRRGVGKPGFPMPPPGGKVWEGAAPAWRRAGVGAGFPAPTPPAPASPARRFPGRTPPNVNLRPRRGGMGQPGFPLPPPGGRVWEGAARKQGMGQAGFPIPSPSGRAWASAAPARMRAGGPRTRAPARGSDGRSAFGDASGGSQPLPGELQLVEPVVIAAPGQ